MKKILLFLIGLFILSCNQKANTKPEAIENKTELSSINENIESFDWLVGNWKRLDNELENKTFENWKKETNNRFLGHGFVMKELDTIWQEKMILSKKESIWVLEVNTPGNDDLVEFSLTEYDSNSFTVENPNHDFPKKIKYWKNKEKLSALVSGNENEINFEFERIK